MKLREADAAGECLRYVGVVDMAKGKGSVELRRYPKSHAFAQLQVGGRGGECAGGQGGGRVVLQEQCLCPTRSGARGADVWV